MSRFSKKQLKDITSCVARANMTIHEAREFFYALVVRMEYKDKKQKLNTFININIMYSSNPRFQLNLIKRIGEEGYDAWDQDKYIEETVCWYENT